MLEYILSLASFDNNKLYTLGRIKLVSLARGEKTLYKADCLKVIV